MLETTFKSKRKTKGKKKGKIVMSDFEINNGILEEYRGNDNDVVIVDGVISIGKSAFQNCASINSLTIPKSVVNIESYALRNNFSELGIISQKDFSCN